ncbi:nitroreductase family protein [Novilysobacter selenitireducens]|uniref:Nitroreductase family protein n=1 Tax=Novilysobacter selenitireducens TaxID=2872639 RepID=A0ABS7T2H2_9GAMM|nr:nitroreductase family protein [Lysobacter selenitireducens]MBZ4038073.1 nitroreductase family protein [Lysobacter selenitireducens]
MWKSLGSPVPRAVPEPYTPLSWPISQSIALPSADAVELQPMTAALQNRRSERAFARLPPAQLSALLWHVGRRLELAPSPLGFAIERRPTPSAGAIHPIHMVLQLPDAHGWARYNPHDHCLDMLTAVDTHLDPLALHCEELVPRGQGQLMLFVAEPGKTAAKYEDAESLVWRDAGVLQGTLALVAASLDLHFCLLGVSGDPWVAALADQGQLRGVGAAILGARP